MTDAASGEHAVQHELVRTGRASITYELRTGGRVTVRAEASGPLLLDGAAIQPVEGPGPWSLAPTRRVAPKTWELTTPAGVVEATCAVAYRRRGAATVQLAHGPDDLRFGPLDSAVLDTVKAAALADTGRFALRRGQEVIAWAGQDRASLADRLRARRDGRRRPVVVLDVTPDASWQPDPVLACALLLFRRHVVPSFRSP